MTRKLSTAQGKLTSITKKVLARVHHSSSQFATRLVPLRRWMRDGVVAIQTGVHPKVVQVIDQKSSSLQVKLQSDLNEKLAVVSNRLDLDREEIAKLSTRTTQLERLVNQIPEETKLLIKEAVTFKHQVVPLLSTDFELSPGRRDTVALPFVNTAGLINPMIVAELDVAGGENNDITLYLSDNYGRTKDNFGQTRSGKFEMPISSNGTYSLHLDNTMSWVSRKSGSLRVVLEYETITVTA